MAELKPCPFCGGEIRLFDTGYFWWTCKGCGVCSKGYFSKEKAIEAWNRRAGDGNDYYKKQSSCTTPDGKEWFASGGG